MNKVILMGRLTDEPDVRYSQGNQPLCIARYTLAVDEARANQDGTRDTNFIRCVAFGRSGEFAERYMHKGRRYLVEGRWKTGSYTNQQNQKVYTNECYVDHQEFADSKEDNGGGQQSGYGGYGQQGYGAPQNGGYYGGGYGQYGPSSGGGYTGAQAPSGQPQQNRGYQNGGYQQPQAAPSPQERYNQQELPLYQNQQAAPVGEGFMQIPDSVDDEGLPFN